MHNPHHWYEFGPLQAPGVLRLALEWRVGWEYGAMLAAQPLLRLAPRGDGHPVLVFPGLLASDVTTLPLRRYLKNRGYAAYPWELGFNLGPRERVVEASLARVKELRRQHGRRVSLIGWSLGGLYAREFAKEAADDVRSVITLGTPFTGHPKATNAWRLYEFATGHKIGAPEIHEPLRAPPPVPTTSIYSRSDGIVAWPCSLNPDAAHTENVEIQASHLGMGMNPLALYAIADRLAQDPASWRRFDIHGARRWFYKIPGHAPGPAVAAAA